MHPFFRSSLLLLAFLSITQSWAAPIDPRTYCDHPLFPLVATLDGTSKWNYQVSDGTTAERVVEAVVPVGLDKASAILMTTWFSANGDVTVPSLMTCADDGLELTMPDGFNLPLPTRDNDLNLSAQLNLTDSNGLFLPPMDAIFEGANWQTFYQYETQLLKDGEPVKAFITKVEIDWTVEGMTDVSVPAGDFVDAWKIKREFTIHLQLPRFSLPAVTSTQYWYLADGVGLIEQVSDRPGLSWQLDAFSIPN